MTSDELDAIEARANAATPGPWNYGFLGDTRRPMVFYQFGQRALESLAGDVIICKGKHAGGDSNMDFIAHAREDIPALIAEVRRLMDERPRAYWKIT